MEAKERKSKEESVEKGEIELKWLESVAVSGQREKRQRTEQSIGSQNKATS